MGPANMFAVATSKTLFACRLATCFVFLALDSTECHASVALVCFAAFLSVLLSSGSWEWKGLMHNLLAMTENVALYVLLLLSAISGWNGSFISEYPAGFFQMKLDI